MLILNHTTSKPPPFSTGCYDAWNRLTAIKEGGDFVAEYAYDPAKRRTIQKSYTSGVLSETRHFYYTEPDMWQAIEERVGSSSSAERQFVWGLRYIDDLVLRDRDTDGNSSLDERLYALQDANWNVTGIANASGTVQERYAYMAYGVPIFLDASFALRASSSYEWETLYASYRWDAAIKLFQIRYRYLLPLFGSWLGRDMYPLTPRARVMSLYVYCYCVPTMWTDPLGLTPISDCKPNRAACIQDVIDALKAVLKAKNCFPPAGPTDTCRPELKDCLLTTLDNMPVRCANKAGAVGYAHGACAVTKDDARSHECKSKCEGRFDYTDPTCEACQPTFMAMSYISIGAGPLAGGFPWGGDPVTDDIGPGWCSIAANRNKLARLILHEMLHNCVGGGHKSDGKGDADKCGRPYADGLVTEFGKNCGAP